MLVDFQTIYNEFEKTKNVCGFCDKYSEDNVATRFLLLRSLDKENLKEIVNKYTLNKPIGNLKSLLELAYNSNVTISDIVRYIESKRVELISLRETELADLTNLIHNFPIVNCGVRNDKVDDIVKSFVRNKSIKTVTELINELDNHLIPRFRQYTLWSYFNQTSNDLIELYLLKCPKIIPTLRKIHDIDFFVRIEDSIIPFDLKITHISDEYFDILESGIDVHKHDNKQSDDSIGGNCDSEMKKIKHFYSLNKRTLNLPNYGGLKKADLIDILKSTNNPNAIDFVNKMQENRKLLVLQTQSDLKKLEWWNYKYQGERLFCNNNRLFIFLSYKNNFNDGRPLKRQITNIGANLSHLFDNLTIKDIHKINYYYEKEASLIGNYSALCLSTIYIE